MFCVVGVCRSFCVCGSRFYIFNGCLSDLLLLLFLMLSSCWFRLCLCYFYVLLFFVFVLCCLRFPSWSVFVFVPIVLCCSLFVLWFGCVYKCFYLFILYLVFLLCVFVFFVFEWLIFHVLVLWCFIVLLSGFYFPTVVFAFNYLVRCFVHISFAMILNHLFVFLFVVLTFLFLCFICFCCF